MKKFKKWLIAQLTAQPVWRVTYKDGRKTYLLSGLEAKSLHDLYGGTLWIDYEGGYF